MEFTLGATGADAVLVTVESFSLTETGADALAPIKTGRKSWHTIDWAQSGHCGDLNSTIRKIC